MRVQTAFRHRLRLATLARHVVLVVILGSLLFPASAWAEETPWVEGEVIIKFKASANQAEKADVLGTLGASTKLRFPLSGGLNLIITKMSVESAIEAYKDDPRIEYIEPNYVVHLDFTPDDPLFGQQWGFENTGQVFDYPGVPGADVSATNAWDVFRGREPPGEPVLVAVLDTGVDLDHPDLEAAIYVNPGEIPDNGLDDDGNGYIDDVHGYNFKSDNPNTNDSDGHGTVIAGVIGAMTHNDEGVAGLNWHVKILPVKYSRNALVGGDYAAAVAGIEYSVMMGAAAINCSFSWAFGDLSALEYAVNMANDAGVFVIASAGNEGDDVDVVPQYPGCFELPNVINVAASDNRDLKTSSSNYGLKNVDLAAPGSRIFTALPYDTYGLYGGHGNGTSFSCPFVVGAMALIRGMYPEDTLAEARTRLLAGIDVVPDLVGKVATDGRLNVFKAIAEPDFEAPATVSDLAPSEIASNWVVLKWSATGDDGLVGAPATYDVRYSTSPITETNFAYAEQAPFATFPLESGEVEHHLVEGLDQMTTYYFALKALDEWGAYGEPGNVSALSNVVEAKTMEPPTIVVDPVLFTAELLPGQNKLVYLTINNTGAGVLDFEIAASPGSEWIVPQTTSGSVAAGGNVQISIELHGDLDCGEHAGSFVIECNDPGQPEVTVPVNLTIAGPGDIHVDAGLVEYGPVGVGLSLSKYLVIENRGCEVLNMQGIFSNNPDWMVRTRVRSIQPGESKAVEIEFAPSELGPSRCDLQIISFDPDEPETIVILVGEGVEPPVVGVSPEVVTANVWTRGTETQNVTVSNTGGHTLDFQIELAPGADWLTVDPLGGTVPPGASLDLEVTFSAEAFCDGDYNTSFAVLSNDPAGTEPVVQADMHVSPASNITIEPSYWDFGEVPVPQDKPLSFVVTVTNNGCEPHTLSVSDVFSPEPAFTARPTSFTLAAGASGIVRVSFNPTEVGDYSANMEFHSDDPDQPVLNMELLGEGIASKKILPKEMSAEDEVAQGQWPVGLNVRNVPNPFNPNTEFRFNLDQATDVLIKIYDARGRLVTTLSGGRMPVGPSALDWNGQNDRGQPVASGVYFYRLLAGRHAITKKMVLLK